VAIWSLSKYNMETEIHCPHKLTHLHKIKCVVSSSTYLFFFLYEHHIRRMRPITYGSHHSYIYSYPFPSSYLLLRFFLYFLKLTASSSVPSPAKDFGWHDPGYIHSAVMTGLEPSSTFSYKYGRLFTTSVTYIC
jgi:hypothetical protein